MEKWYKNVTGTPLMSSDSVQVLPKKRLIPAPYVNVETGPTDWSDSINSCGRQESNCTPFTFQKISSWINSIHVEYLESHDSAVKPYLDFSETSSQENGFDIDGDILDNMYNSCEYKSFELDQKPITEDQLDNFCIKKYHDYIDDSDEPSKRFFNGGVSRRYSSYKPIKQSSSILNHRSLKKETKSDDYESDVPLSPESEKKKELCSYLQLMKPSDKKTVMILQNRRSVRVKNLSLMQERRELEKKLKEENFSNTNSHVQCDSSGGCPEIKPFNNGINYSVDKKTKWLKYNGSKQSIISTFTFPKPPSFLSENVNHFDDAFVDLANQKTLDAQNTKILSLSQVSDRCEEPFIMPKVPLKLKYKVTDFDDVMGDRLFSVESRFHNEKEKKYEDLNSKQTIDRNSYKKKLNRRRAKASNLITRRITRNRPQLISDIIHSLRNRNIGRSTLKKYQKLKDKYKNVRSKKEFVERSHEAKTTPSVRTEDKITPQFIYHEEPNDLQNFIPDIDFNSLSDEHQQSLLINAQISQNLVHLPLVHFCYNSNSNDTQAKSKKNFSIEKLPENLIVPISDEKTFPCNGNNVPVVNNKLGKPPESTSGSESPEPLELNSNVVNDRECVNNILEETPKVKFNEFKKDVGTKSLHRCLSSPRRKSTINKLERHGSSGSWTSENFNMKPKKNRHSITISRDHGSVLKAFYLDYNLILCQELLVSFWTQTALGNVLGAQNMWIHKGNVQRLAINNNCVFKESLEMVVSTEYNVAYVELWTKEHQSDIREGPVADVFATVYFWKNGQNGLDKKVLQLENINGFADDVQYSVLKSTPRIIVSWHLASNELENKKTYVHCYQLAADYQTVYNISEFESVEHYVSSLHSIEDCDNIIAGCGENKITLWNIDYGYVVATIEMSEIKSPLSTLWVKCDRGFLFTLQQCVGRELRLIAIHGMNHSWKKLASYVPPEEYDRLKGVCVENGIIIAFYDQGILCWNAHTAETIIEESTTEAGYISGKYVINVINDQLNIRHAFTHLLYSDEL